MSFDGRRGINLLLVEVVGHHCMEGLLEVGEFTHEVLGEHQVLHVLKVIRKTVD